MWYDKRCESLHRSSLYTIRVYFSILIQLLLQQQDRKKIVGIIINTIPCSITIFIDHARKFEGHKFDKKIPCEVV